MSNNEPIKHRGRHYSQKRILDYNHEPNAFYQSMNRDDAVRPSTKDLLTQCSRMKPQDFMSKCCDALLQVEPKRCVRQSVMEEYVEAQMEVINRMGLNAAVVHMFEEYYLSPKIKPLPADQRKRPSSFANKMWFLGWEKESQHMGIMRDIFKDIDKTKNSDSVDSDGAYFESMYEVKGQAGRKSSFANRLNNILIHDGVDEVIVNVGGAKIFDMKTGGYRDADVNRVVLDTNYGVMTYTDDMKSITITYNRHNPEQPANFQSGMYSTIAALQQLEHMQQVRKEFGVK